MPPLCNRKRKMQPDETKKRLGRILNLVPLAAKRRGADLLELADYLGCGIDELVRDVHALIMCGVPPYSPSDYVQAYVEDGRLHINFPGGFKRPVRLSADEHAALQCALMQAERAAGPGGAPDIRELMRKLAVRRSGRRVRDKDYVYCTVQVKMPEKKRAVLQQAIDRQKELIIEYHSLRSGVTTRRRVRPYALLARSHRWYLVAYDKKHRKTIPFRGDRIRHASITDTDFQRPEYFDLTEYLEGRMYINARPTMSVRVRFGPEYARFIAEKYPPEALQKRGGGCIDLRLDTDSLNWAARWVLKHGPYATAREPKELRREIVHACDEILEAYGDGDCH